MTLEQWLFEYHALRRKEEGERQVMVEAMKAGAKAFRDILIGVLGLDAVAPKPAARSDGEVADRGDAPPPFIPAAYVMGNHHLLSVLLEAKEKEGAAQAALDDTAFDEFSRKLAAGEIGDLDPVLVGDIDTSYWATKEARELEARLVKETPGVGSRLPGGAPHVGPRRPRGVQILEDGELGGGLEAGGGGDG